MATTRGIVKKSRLSDFSRPRSSGIRAVNLDENDHLVGVAVTNGSEDVLLISDAGKAARFSENDVRVVGRTARGVRGIRLDSEQKVISLMVLPAIDSQDSATEAEMAAILTSTINGYGKRTLASDFPRKRRGGKGVIAIKTSSRNGQVVSAHIVNESDEVMLITDGGILIRTRISEISTQGRNTQGVRLISLKNDERLVSVSKLVDTDDEEESEAIDPAVH
jgi:DNA gyrase subunit A